MLDQEQIALLEQLRFGQTAADRAQALNSLKLLEKEGRFDADDLVSMLDEEEIVLKSYGIGALGRLKMKEGLKKLKELFDHCHDPLLLPELLDAITAIGGDELVESVLKKLGNKDDALLWEQLVLPSLKYLKTTSAKGIENQLLPLLSEEDETIRWHTLQTFDALGLSIPKQTLETIKTTDTHSLVREQASVLLEKLKTTDHQ